MSKKEQEPRENREDREQQPKNMGYNPDITEEDKEVLNNQSEEGKGDYFKDRQEPIDYEGEDLDIPEMDDEQFNPTRNKADDSEKEELPKESVESEVDIESESETIYKGEKAEEYHDPSEKTRKEEGKTNGKRGGVL